MSVVCRSGAHAPNCSVTDSDVYIGRNFRHLEVHSTFTLAKKSECLVVEVSLMEQTNTACAAVLRRGVRKKCALCILSLRDIAKRFFVRTA